jgi:hypothetical protein
MRKMSFATLVGGAALIAAMTTAACSEPQAQASAQKSDPARIARGQYLVTIGGCNDCHTPLKMGPKGPEPDMTRMLSGHPEQFVISAPAKMPSQEWMIASAPTNTAHSGPWGVSFTANLTPDQNTGLGIWTEEMFLKAIRTGRHMGVSREILPPMPWPAFRNATDEDLKSIYAYLRSIKPVVNHVPDAQLAPAPVENIAD